MCSPHPVAQAAKNFYDSVENHASDLVEGLSVAENFSLPNPVEKVVSSKILYSSAELHKHVVNYGVFLIVFRITFCKSTSLCLSLWTHWCSMCKCLDKIEKFSCHYKKETKKSA